MISNIITPTIKLFPKKYLSYYPVNLIITNGNRSCWNVLNDFRSLFPE